ncbi:MAG TPA: HDOD domain-containing protein [Steroidobacteraceae bacterium]|nr:HDOD domain-containing protein [Steroidobacteraceae bacterium]HRX88177.1 HDOD domain-containing protein [Steroidobacteraceae bacterium]
MTSFEAAAAERAAQEADLLIGKLRVEHGASDLALPCFPQSAVRLQSLLGEPEVALDDVIKVLSFDPVLTGRVLQLANSVACNSSGKRIADLRVAITRIGFDLTRSAVIAAGLKRLVEAEAMAEIRLPLKAIWERSAWMAATGHVVAGRFTSVRPDQAFLAGLLHGIGELYLLTRATEHAPALNDARRWRAIVREWQPVFNLKVLSAWAISDEIIDAIRGYQSIERTHEGPADLLDVMTASYLLVGLGRGAVALDSVFDKIHIFKRMHLTIEQATDAMRDAADEIDELRHTLG